MDESGGSGQPRPGNDQSAHEHAGSTTPSARPGPPAPDDPGTRPPADERPTRRHAPDEPSSPAPTPDDPTTDEPPTDEPAGTEGTGAAGTGAPAAAAGPRPDADTVRDNRDTTADADTHTDTKGERAHGPESSRPPAATAPGTASTPKPPAGTPDAKQPEDASSRSPEPPRPPTPPADFGAPGPGRRGKPEGHDPHRTLAHSGRRRPPKGSGPGGGLLMGRPFGVPVYVAPSWFLVAALITWVFGGQLDRILPELGAARYLVSLFFAVAFYASVLVHELAHTIAALRFKLPVRRIQLQFFGGVSEIEKEAETPGREFVLAFVGPLLSLVLAGVFYLAVQTVEPGTVPGVLLAGLMISNLIVAVFNLLPGLPLDGGRMLRAVVWKISGRPMAGTVAAAWVGRALAVAVLVGLPLLTQSGTLGSAAEDSVGMDTVMDALLAAILAAIIWTGAGNSLRMARLREHLPELRARALTRRAVPVETDTPLSEALRRANAAGARALVVVDSDGNPLSLVREAAIVGVPEHRRPWVAVSGLAQDLTDGMRVSAELAGEELLEALRATPATEYLVVEETGEIYGVLSAADVERAFVKAMARPS
ncbi:MAG TPA: site-2 protease family protein [Streptomyces sp.]|nr:site-2 protease family protein [Streptomyces sp.]